MGYRFGFLLGLAVGVAAGLVCLLVLFRKKVLDMHFDERQERARGKAYQYGFLTLAAVMLALGGLDAAGFHWCDLMAGMTLCICAGTLVFAAAAIWKDAYLGLYETPWKVAALFAVLSVFNLGIGMSSLMGGRVVEDGVLTFRATNLLVGGLLLVILGLYALRCMIRRETEEDGE